MQTRNQKRLAIISYKIANLTITQHVKIVVQINSTGIEDAQNRLPCNAHLVRYNITNKSIIRTIR